MAACVTDVARAAEPFAKVGTYGMQWLQMPRGVRSIGMGETGTADASGTGTGYFNPASVAFSDAISVTGSYQDWHTGGLNLSEAVVSSPIPFRSDSTSSAWHFAASFGYARLGMDPQTERTIFLPDGTGRTFDASDWGLMALGAASWTSGVATLAAGANGKYLHSNLASDDITGWALDLGLLAAFPFDLGEGGVFRPRLGYAVLNLDDGISYDGRDSDIENRQRGGFGFDMALPTISAWGRPVHAASLSLDYDLIDREIGSGRTYAAGFEMSVAEFMHFRYGTVDDDYRTVGLGLSWDYGQVLFRVDYARQNVENWLFPDDRDTFGALVGVRW
jgi:hypothetical protein